MDELKLNPSTCFTSYKNCEREAEEPPVPEWIAKIIKSKGYHSVREYVLKEYGKVVD